MTMSMALYYLVYHAKHVYKGYSKSSLHQLHIYFIIQVTLLIRCISLKLNIQIDINDIMKGAFLDVCTKKERHTDDVESESTRYVCKWGSFCSFVSILS